MLDAIASTSILAWPLALTLATVVASERTRSRRRRARLNRSLHELRRPLQALTLSWQMPASGGRDHLGLALEALGELDRHVNGGVPPATTRSELVEARTLVIDAVRRWRGPAATASREIGLRWSANGSRLVCDRVAVARALDNLIANALEHGSGTIQLEGTVREGRLRIAVADGCERERERVAAVGPARPRSTRRGHGLRIVAEIAADHGGRFAACAHGGGATAILELPLAGVADTAAR